jgi:hypothetical protein
VGIVVWAFGLYQSGKAWYGLVHTTAEGYRSTQEYIRQKTSDQHRAAAWMALWSAFAVGFVYALATIINALVQTAQAEGVSSLFSSKIVEHAVAVKQWSPAAIWAVSIAAAGIFLLAIARIAKLTGMRKIISFVGGVACTLAWIAAVAAGVDSLVGFAGRGLSSQDPPPMPLVVTEAITAVMCLALGLLLPRISKTSRAAFSFDSR